MCLEADRGGSSGDIRSGRYLKAPVRFSNAVQSRKCFLVPARCAGRDERKNPTQAGIGIKLNRGRHQTQSGSASDLTGVGARSRLGLMPTPVESVADSDWVDFDLGCMRFRSRRVVTPIPPSRNADLGGSCRRSRRVWARYLSESRTATRLSSA
uniref:Uncharacterized protein n=1 Tax=Candidatus Kentrum sp. MB TaxID=2138164 RepID=A0A450XNS8_9GAMM|nr:MAG: hypothetical protein BECKMB1821I_GA0114274_10196 [Candidatus Kentron sp. MB]VFK75745.1 MAG: hypothetical protein BECKMB1821H_GA0114242_103028 [Candidatus Kentron sp. MB]